MTSRPETARSTPPTSGSTPTMICRGYLFPERRARLTGGSRRAEWALSHGYARLGQIPKRLRGDGEEITRERVNWLEAQMSDDEWAACEEMMAAAVKLGKMLTGEMDTDNETDEQGNQSKDE